MSSPGGTLAKSANDRAVDPVEIRLRDRLQPMPKQVIGNAERLVPHVHLRTERGIELSVEGCFIAPVERASDADVDHACASIPTVTAQKMT